MSAEIKCAECGWHWKLAKGGKDPYTCHNCGHKTPPMPNELHRMDHDAHDEHHQLRADVEERLGDKGENPCWRGYHPVGLKPNGDPNCVPIDETDSFCTECLMEYLTENWGIIFWGILLAGPLVCATISPGRIFRVMQIGRAHV